MPPVDVRAGVPVDRAAGLPEGVRAALDRISDGVVALDRDWRSTFVNAPAATLLGRQVGELLGQHLWALFPTGEGQPLHRACDHAQRTGEVVVVEAPSPPLGRWFAHRVHPSADGLTIYFQDVTAQRRADRGARAAIEDLSAVMQAIGDAVIVIDGAGCVRHLNHAAAALTGWPEADAVGRALGDVARLLDAASRAPVEHLAAHTGPIDAQLGGIALVLIGRDGQERAIEGRAAPIRGGDPAGGGSVLVLCDQHARQATAQALVASEERLRLALRSATQGLYDLDVGTGEATVTPEYATMLGYDPATFRETTDAWIERLHPDDRDRVVAYFQDYLAGRTADYRLEFRQRTHAGAWRWILSLGSIVDRAPDGSPRRMLGTHTDITDRRETEERVRRSEQDLEITLQSIGDGVITTDAAARVVRMNPTAERLTGWTIAEAVGRPLREVFPVVDTETGAPIVDPAQAALESGVAVELGNHTSLIARGGQVRQIADSAAPIRGPDSAVSGVVLVFSDVTEKYKIQEALREREHRLRTIIDNEPECVKVLDATGRLLEMNPAGLAMLEVASLQEAQRHPLTTFVTPEHRTGFAALHREVLSGVPGQLEFEVVGARGTRRWLETHAVPLLDPAHGPVLLGITRDITERKRAELERETLAAQRSIAERMESIGQLAGGLAHDFNNLLSVINTTAELAMDDLPEGTPLRQDLADIRAAGDRAAELTAQLLAFSRVRAITPERIDAGTVVLAAQPVLARLIRENITLSVRATPATCPVLMPAGELERVVMNLVVNGRDAMPHGGHLTVTVAEVVLGAEARGTLPPLPPGAYVAVAVADNGAGISDEVLPRIFDPFFSTKERSRGTGLGLSSSYAIVRQSDGGFAVETSPGRGSTFRFFLPKAASDTVQAASPPIAADAARGHETVLIVDDELAMVRLVQRVLDTAGYTTMTATSGDEALRLAAELTGPLHLLLTDVIMPAMNGPELAVRLTALRPEARVLYSSGYADDLDLCRALLSRSAALISKPWTPAELRRRIREVLDRRDDAA